MTRLSPTQIRALNHAAEHGSVTNDDGYTRATIGALKSYGLMAYNSVTRWDAWTATLTPSGQAWIRRNSPEKQAEHARSESVRAEYRRRAAKYLTDAKSVLGALSTGDGNVSRAVTLLAKVTHPAKSPAKVEAVGWWLTDNNVSGWAYEIGCALRDIGEDCGRAAYSVDRHALDRLTTHEEAIAKYKAAVEK